MREKEGVKKNVKIREIPIHVLQVQPHHRELSELRLSLGCYTEIKSTYVFHPNFKHFIPYLKYVFRID